MYLCQKQKAKDLQAAAAKGEKNDKKKNNPGLNVSNCANSVSTELYMHFLAFTVNTLLCFYFDFTFFFRPAPSLISDSRHYSKML